MFVKWWISKMLFFLSLNWLPVYFFVEITFNNTSMILYLSFLAETLSPILYTCSSSALYCCSSHAPDEKSAPSEGGKKAAIQLIGAVPLELPLIYWTGGRSPGRWETSVVGSTNNCIIYCKYPLSNLRYLKILGSAGMRWASRMITRHVTPIGSFVKALWADAFYKSIRLCVCSSVCPCVRVFTFCPHFLKSNVQYF